MNILISGASGFVGKNLAESLKNLRGGKDRTRPDLKIDEIFLARCDEYDNFTIYNSNDKPYKNDIFQ